MITSSFNDRIQDLILDPIFNLVIGQLNDGILIADRDAYIRYVNAAYTRIVGTRFEDVLGKKIQEARKGSRLPEVLQSGQPLLGIRRNVNEIEYIADINPIISDNKVVGAISIVRDITQIVQLSNSLRAYTNRVTKLENTVMNFHRSNYSFDDIIGSSREINKVKQIARRIASSDIPVLILGESGSGKERFAHAIHQASPRKSNSFVAINCAALPPNLLLSEIFGYEEGSFSGASKGGKLGLFDIAHGGTLFLDEIGDMDFELQSNLLRVIETGEFLRIGSTKPTKVDVRIISATNKDLETLIKTNRFREDLYYRLNVVSLKIPPLRDRLDDIPALSTFILDSICKKQNKTCRLSEESMQLLMQYHYPGNIRELINILEFCVSTGEDELIRPADLPIIGKIKRHNNHLGNHPGTLSSVTQDMERNAIIEALKNHDLSVSGKRKAASQLGISLATLYNKIKQYNIKI